MVKRYRPVLVDYHLQRLLLVVRRPCRNMKTLALLIFVVLLMAGLIYYEISVWRECMQTNKWWYCLRILG